MNTSSNQKYSLRICFRTMTAILALTIAACGGGGGESGTSNPPAILLDPTAFTATAPATYVARFATSEGIFRVEVTRSFAPLGADRFFNLVRNGYYDDVRFFRVLPGFVAQFGISGFPSVNAVWREQRITDDPVTQSNLRGTLTFATGGANTRTTQVFINLADNVSLNNSGFAPFGRVIEGMDVVSVLYADYGDGPPSGSGPNQSRIQTEGNSYLNASFPQLDFVLSATIE